MSSHARRRDFLIALCASPTLLASPAAVLAQGPGEPPEGDYTVLANPQPVSYTHLTLPTIYSV